MANLFSHEPVDMPLSQVLTEFGVADEVFTLFAGMAASPEVVALSPEGHLVCDAGISLVMARIESMEEAQQNIFEIKAKCAAGLRDTDHPDWCDARRGDMVIGLHGGIYEVVLSACSDCWRSMKIPMTGLMDRRNIALIFKDSPSAALSRPSGKFLSLMVRS